jgi:hypothetical protein
MIFSGKAAPVPSSDSFNSEFQKITVAAATNHSDITKSEALGKR